MKIEYICHSALLIETGDVKILTDPWLKGAAYCNQWHLFPKPMNITPAQKADVILISHGHEDHLHYESLLMLDRNSRIFYPFQWQKGIREYLNGMGYFRVSEAFSHRSYKISPTTTVTYIANSLDSIMVVESGSEVLVNINDALPANHRNIIAGFLKKIKSRWPLIDYLFCGYGSAAYFPNTVHCEGKNDLEVAEAREQLFGDNFCYIVNELAPKNTIPFAADYVLLNHEKRWINRVKFTKGQIRDYYFNVYKGRDTNFICAHPGDIIERDGFLKRSEYHGLENKYSLDHLINAALEAEIRSVNEIGCLGEEHSLTLERQLYGNVKKRSALFSPDILSGIKYTVEVSDIQDKRFFFIDCSGSEIKVIRTHQVDPASILVLRTTSRILNYSFASDWGGDAIVIGYGAEINILDKACLDKSLDIVCVRLLTNQPVASRQMKASPVRALKYLFTNPLTTSWAVKQMIRGRNRVNKNPVNERSIWLAKSKCEICQVCDIPFLSDDFAEQLNSPKPS
jgi:hypothetical protein